MIEEYESEDEDPATVPRFYEHLRKFPPLLLPNEDPRVPYKEFYEVDENAEEGEPERPPVKITQLKRALT